MKLIKQLLTAYKNWNKEQLIKQEAKEKELQLNALLNLVFKDKLTYDAIQLKEQFNIEFDKEIAKRGLNAQLEHTDCEDYFNKKHKSLNYGKATT